MHIVNNVINIGSLLIILLLLLGIGRNLAKRKREMRTLESIVRYKLLRKDDVHECYTCSCLIGKNGGKLVETTYSATLCQKTGRFYCNLHEPPYDWVRVDYYGEITYFKNKVEVTKEGTPNNVNEQKPINN